jgi:hypothetical protein
LDSPMPDDIPKLTTGKGLLQALRNDGLVGMWADRTDIGDSSEFADRLRGRSSRYMSIIVADSGPMRIERIDEARLRGRLIDWLASKRAMDTRDLSAVEMLGEIEGLLGEGDS